MPEKNIDQILEEYFAGGINEFLPHISINIVVLAYDNPVLKVLVQRAPGTDFWSLPGGYIKKSENLIDAAYRNLSLSGINNVFLRQVRTFGEVNRVTESLITEGHSAKYDEIMAWATKRFITVVYYGLVVFGKTKIKPGGISVESKWTDIGNPGILAFDHASILAQTAKILVSELLDHPIAQNLLPEAFSLNDLRGLYEAILRRKIDRGTFRRKMLSKGIIVKVDRRIAAQGRPADIFSFNKIAYLDSLKEETKFGF